MTEGANPPAGQALTVVPDDVAEIGRFIFGAAQNLRSGLDAMNREVADLTSTGWTGNASKSFDQGWHECQVGGGQIIDALTSMAGKLGITAKNFQQQDNRTATAISSLDLP